jgi:hypothetical protein
MLLVSSCSGICETMLSPGSTSWYDTLHLSYELHVHVLTDNQAQSLGNYLLS